MPSPLPSVQAMYTVCSIPFPDFLMLFHSLVPSGSSLPINLRFRACTVKNKKCCRKTGKSKSELRPVRPQLAPKTYLRKYSLMERQDMRTVVLGGQTLQNKWSESCCWLFTRQFFPASDMCVHPSDYQGANSGEIAPKPGDLDISHW